MMRFEIRRRALHAAAAVSFATGAFGCGGTVTQEPLSGSSSGTEATSGSATTGGATATSGSATTGGATTTTTGSAGGAPAMAAGTGGFGGAGGIGGGGGLGTTGIGGARGVALDGGPCDRDAGTQAYLACCQAEDWSPDAGCEAWGPPMPPSMRPSRELA